MNYESSNTLFVGANLRQTDYSAALRRLDRPDRKDEKVIYKIRRKRVQIPSGSLSIHKQVRLCHWNSSLWWSWSLYKTTSLGDDTLRKQLLKVEFIRNALVEVKSMLEITKEHTRINYARPIVAENIDCYGKTLKSQPLGIFFEGSKYVKNLCQIQNNLVKIHKFSFY